jgi:hypothetical protein
MSWSWPRGMFHVVQPYGKQGDYGEATIVASLPTIESAWEYLDSLWARMAAGNVPPGALELVVVDDARRLIPRPSGTIL